MKKKKESRKETLKRKVQKFFTPRGNEDEVLKRLMKM